MGTTALATLSHKLITRTAPPSLIDLRDLLLTSETYAEFMRIVHEFTPEIEADVKRAAGPANKMMAFANAFEPRYFPLHPSFAEGLQEEYYDICSQIPVVTLAVSWDSYHELADGYWPKGLMLAAYILADPYGNIDSPEGERVALADACAKFVRKEDLARVPLGGISEDDVHKLLDGTRFEALATVSDILHYDAGDCFHDNDEEMISQGGPDLDWDRENVEALTRGWLKAQATEEKVGKLYSWLEEDLLAHFAELLDFIEDRQKKRAAKPAKVVKDPEFRPRNSDKQWLVDFVRTLSIGGVWIAPMGFRFEKVAENHLRLQQVSISPKLRADALEAIRRTVLVGKECGVRIDTDVLEETQNGGDNDTDTRTRTAPMELAAVAGGGAGPIEGQARLL